MFEPVYAFYNIITEYDLRQEIFFSSHLRCTRFFILPQEIQAIKFLFLSSFLQRTRFLGARKVIFPILWFIGPNFGQNSPREIF